MFREVPDQKALEHETAALIECGFSKPDWNAAWSEGTKFVDRSRIHRFQGRYIEALIPDFEQRWMERFREWLFRTFLCDVSTLYEFGSGSAHNLMAYRTQFPNKEVVALDYAPSAVALAEKAGIGAALFDFTQPDESLSLSPNGGVLTFCALEQVADASAFVDYLRAQKPKRVVHVEPVVEWYSDSPFDRLASSYHAARGYVRGLPAIPNAVYKRRMGFGSRFHEGYSCIVWEP